MYGIIECDKCRRCVFYAYFFEDQYLEKNGILEPNESYSTNEHRMIFLDSLPKCECGGRFIEPSQHHELMETQPEYRHYPLCPLCRNGNRTLTLLSREARKDLEFGIWVPFMNRWYRAGPNSYEEPIPEETEYVNWDDAEAKKPRFIVGMGLLNGKVTDAF